MNPPDLKLFFIQDRIRILTLKSFNVHSGRTLFKARIRSTGLVPCQDSKSCGACAVQIGEVASILFSSDLCRSAVNLNTCRSKSSIFKKTDPQAQRISAKNYVKSFSIVHVCHKRTFITMFKINLIFKIKMLF
jgi:hypothetical protein